MPSANSRFFASNHAIIAPFGGEPPQQIGVHYLESFTHPGDSLQIRETCAVLALPLTAPWGATRDALGLVLELKPRFVVPVHDWFWHDEARVWAYDRLKAVMQEQGITFLPLHPGESYELDDTQLLLVYDKPKLIIE